MDNVNDPIGPANPGTENIGPQETNQPNNKEEQPDNKKPEFNIMLDPKREEDKKLAQTITEWLKKTYNITELVSIAEAIWSLDRFKQHYGVIGLRKILSNENGPPIQAAIDANLVPRLIYFMSNDYEPHLQFEAAWALTNIASGTSQQATVVVENGGIPSFIRLLKSPKLDIVEQAIWGLGNLAGDSTQFRDMILRLDGLGPLVQVLNSNTTSNMFKHGIWALSNLCQGKPFPDSILIRPAIPTLCRVVKTQKDSGILTDALRALSHISKRSDNIDDIFETDIIPSLVRLMQYNISSEYANSYRNVSFPIDLSCLQLLGGFLSGTDWQTNSVLNTPEFLPKVFRCLQHARRALRREVCWGLSNVAAGTPEQIDKIIGNQYYVDMLIKAAISDVPEVQREAAWIFSNASKHGTTEQAKRMIECGVLDMMLYLLNSNDPKTVEVILHGMESILDSGEDAANENDTENEFLILLEEKGGIEKLEKLQTHPNDEVYLLAQKILEKFFEVESFDED